MENKWHIEEIQHTADWGIRVKAKSPEALFKGCAVGMYELLKAQPDKAQREERRAIELRGVDMESLLVAFLSELLFYYETEDLVFPEIKLFVVNNELVGEVKGFTLKVPGEEIKAVTYHQMKIEHTPEGLSVIVVFDV